MPKVLIVCDTRTGETRQIGELIAEGVRMAGAEAVVKNAKSVKALADLEGFDAYVFGSATYHGDMLQGMKTLLFLGEQAGLAGKAGGAFGAYGWSGEAPERIFDTMQHIYKMKMVSGPLRLKASTIGGGIQAAQSYGKEITQALGS